MPRNVPWDLTAVNENSGGFPPYEFDRGAPDIQDYKSIMLDNLNRYFGIASRSGWMYNKTNPIQYDGVKYASVPTIDVSGMGNYRRNKGYALGASNLSYEKFEVTMDRSTHLSIDRLDQDETGGLMSTFEMAKRQMDREIIPEVDAYNYSSIYAKVYDDFPENVTGGTIKANQLLNTLRLEKAKLDNEFSIENYAYIMTPITATYLTAGYEKIVGVQDFAPGTIFEKVKTIDGIPIFEVPGLRFHTAYEFGNGTLDPDAVDLDDLGFKVAEVGGSPAPEMLYMIAPLDSVQAFTKLNVPKVITFDENQDVDSNEYKLRLVYDNWIRKEDAETIRISTATLDLTP